jgi:hypothetical protein
MTKKSFLIFTVTVGMMIGSASGAKAAGSVRIYADKGFLGRVFRVGVGKNVPDFKYGSAGFNDICSSVKYSIPAGWTAILYTDSGYKGREYPMSGTSAASDIGSFEDKCSSLQWVRQ